MLAGISQRIIEVKQNKEVRDSLSHDWSIFCKKISVTPISLPNESIHAEDILKNVGLDLIILSGGEDICPDSQRDRTEFLLIKLALERRLPILAICRGFQLLNTYFEGKILDKIENYTKYEHAGSVHSITLTQHPFNCLKDLEKIEVNSFHTQGIHKKHLAPGLIPFAICDDIVEGYFNNELKILGFQWHPERKGPNNSIDSIIIKEFLRSHIMERQK